MRWRQNLKNCAIKYESLTADIVRRALDYDAISGVLRWKWREDVGVAANERFAGRRAGTQSKEYRVVRLNGFQYLEHILAWLWVTGKFPAIQIDHRNLDGFDNRWSNLREATQSQNNANRPKCTGWSPWKGVHQRGRRWRAHITANRKTRYIGTFDCPAAAHFSYIIEANREFGEFSRAA